ncbi:MAG TPA: hypothetical protein VK186_11380 [Candidatus Deferrimicrobium sp.]|nr:hypothetical protein [Candidatus Deferrimicrobium sp.]
MKKRRCFSKKEAVSKKKKLFTKKRSCFSKKEGVSQKKKLFLKKRSCSSKKEAVHEKKKLFLKKRSCFPKKEAVLQKKSLCSSTLRPVIVKHLKNIKIKLKGGQKWHEQTKQLRITFIGKA